MCESEGRVWTHSSLLGNHFLELQTAAKENGNSNKIMYQQQQQQQHEEKGETKEEQCKGVQMCCGAATTMVLCKVSLKEACPIVNRQQLNEHVVQLFWVHNKKKKSVCNVCLGC